MSNEAKTEERPLYDWLDGDRMGRRRFLKRLGVDPDRVVSRTLAPPLDAEPVVLAALQPEPIAAQ